MGEGTLNKSIEPLKELLKDKSIIYDANYCLATSQAIKNLISEFEILQKENEELKDRYYREKVAKEEVEELLENSIPKEKIKEIFDIKIHNYNYLSKRDWCEQVKCIDKQIANLLKIILEKILKEE